MSGAKSDAVCVYRQVHELSRELPVIRTRDIELAIARGLFKAYPWLHRVRRLPGGGLMDCSAVWRYPEAANERRIALAESKISAGLG